MEGEPRLGRRLIFVGGSPRSGTTLTQSMLDSHPDICGGPEFDRMPDVIRLRKELRESVDSGRISVYCSGEDVDRELGLFVERLLLSYAESRGCELMSEKTPWNVLVFKDLLEVFPGARFIFCVRDPRAVTASMLQVGERARKGGRHVPSFTRSTAAIMRTIKRTNRAGFEAVRLSERVLPVIYERLVVEPERETKRICGFLGLPWSGEMLRPGEKEHDGGKVLDGVWHYPRMYDSDPDPSRANKWRTQLTPTRKAMVAGAFGEDEDLLALGYRFHGEELPAAQRAVGRIGLGLSAVASSGFSSLLALVQRVPALESAGSNLLSRVKESRGRRP